MEIERTVRLTFGIDAHDAGTHINLSAVRTDGRCLWIAGDETATVERLTADDPGSPEAYDDHLTFHLGDLIELAGDDEEVDVEGLARSGPYLWVAGSHSLVRKKVKPDHADAKAIRRLARIEDRASRSVLARLPVVETEGGLPTLVAQATTDSGTATAAVLGRRTGEQLTSLLKDDPHLAPFLAIPGKDNGFDLEGVAMLGDRLMLGLRGPVLRGWAVILELAPWVGSEDPATLQLRRIGDDGEPYRKHFLDLDGLGVRDLCPSGNDLLVLAGPTMDLDGPVRVFRWHDAAAVDRSEVVRGDEISVVGDLPFGHGDDHAEGITLLPGGIPRLLVVYDSPAPRRLSDGGDVLADIVRLPG